VLALIIFGPGKLPEVGKAVGKAMTEFKRVTRAAMEEDVRPSKPSASAEEAARAADGAEAGPGESKRA
ncbi:MAG TPA: twin-arginine translocase TatA/TatE family subunit, partial [Limnochordia bacterium]